MAKTTKGFEYEIKDMADDFEVVELLRSIQDNPLLIIDLAKKVLGEDGYKSLKEFCTVDGKVSTALINESLDEILNTNAETKK